VRVTLRSGESTSLPGDGNPSRLALLIGRILILLTAVLLAAMPLMEHFWTFDGAFAGGQDFEFGLLSIATIFCLVLVVSQRCRQGVSLLLKLRRRTSFLVPKIDKTFQMSGESLLSLRSSLHRPVISCYNPPLLI
jgi:hypothetical protein